MRRGIGGNEGSVTISDLSHVRRTVVFLVLFTLINKHKKMYPYPPRRCAPCGGTTWHCWLHTTLVGSKAPTEQQLHRLSGVACKLHPALSVAFKSGSLTGTRLVGQVWPPSRALAMGSLLARLQHEASPELRSGSSDVEAGGAGRRSSPPPAQADDVADKPYQEGGGGGTRFTDLPEACLALILSHVGNPRDVIRLALVSRSFRDASRSDTVWEGLLPRNYAELVRDAEDGPVRYSLKKEVYDVLCKGVYLDDGNKAFWVDPPTGATCLMVSARALYIVWGDDPRYWKWVTKHGSRFKEVAHLETVCWLEVRGHMACQLTPGRYTLSWRIQMSEFLPIPQRVNHPWRFPHVMVSTAHAWNHKPVKFSLSTGDGQQADSARYLDGQSTPSERQLTLSNLATVVGGKGKWMEYVAGEFVVDSDGYVDLDFSMMEIEGGNWKEGLFLDGVAIRPSRQT